MELIQDNKVLNTTETDSNGNYIFSKDALGKDLKPGIYVVRVIRADGYVTFITIEVKVNAGDVVLNEDMLIDPYGIVYDEYGGLEYPIEKAEVKLISNCDDPNSLVKLDDLDKSKPQKNPYITSKDGKYLFYLNRSQITDKTYCIIVKADGYKDRTFLARISANKLVTVKTTSGEKVAGRAMLEVFNDKKARTVLNNVESIPYNIPIIPLRTFELDKKVNKGSIELGDVVTYTVQATNKLKYKLTNGLITDKLPFGFKYVPGTLSINDKLVTNFKAIDELKILIGNMNPNQKYTVVYQAMTGIRVEGGPSVNKAEVSAVSESGSDLKEGPVFATVIVKKGVFSKNGTIIGRVYIDNNNNGIPDNGDIGVENISIYTAGGVRVLSDSKGKFSIPDIANGNFIVHFDKTSLPENLYVPSEAINMVNNTNLAIKGLTSSEIDLSNFTKQSFYVSDKGNIKFKFNKKGNYKSLLILENGDIVNLNKENNLSYKKLHLKEKANKLIYKITDEKDQIIEQRNIQVYLIPEISQPTPEKWIGEDDIIRRIYVPESGLAKVNFRLVKLKKLLLPNEDKKNALQSLMGVYVYPGKFSAKEIPKITYPDIKHHWAQETIEYESGLDIIHGYPDGNFKPGRNITRSETTKLTLVALNSFDIKMETTLAYILQTPAKVNTSILNSHGQEVKIFNQEESKNPGINMLHWDGRDNNSKLLPPGKYIFSVKAVDNEGNINTLSTVVEIVSAIPNFHPNGKASYKDINAKHWSNSFIKVGTEDKLVKGYPDNTFRPDALIPRYEMAVIAVNALNLDVRTGRNELPFEDEREVPHWARKYVYLAYMQDLLPRFPDNKFRPLRPISRAEISLFVKNLIRQQKVKTQLRGIVSQYQNSLIIDGKTLDLSKNKSFEIPAQKSNFESFNIIFPGLKNLEVHYDEKYYKQSILENSKGGSGEIPLPTDETNGDPNKKQNKTDATTEPNKEVDERVNFISTSDININAEDNDKRVLDVPAAALTFSTENGLVAKITVNGKEINYGLLGKTQINNKTSIKTFTYYGVELQDGKNIIEASSLDNAGNVFGKIFTKEVYVKGPAAKIIFEPTKIPADGKTVKDITIDILDKLGNPVTDGQFVTIKLEAGQIKTVDQNPTKSDFQVRTVNGKAVFQVLPPNESQVVKIEAEINSIMEKGFVEYTTPLRTPILVGSASQNSGYSFLNNKTFPDDPKGKAGLNFNIGASLFTQGTIFNDYLLTFALDTQRKLNALNDDPNILLRDRAEDSLYPIYGDSSQLNQVAVSNSNVFLKLEKDKSSLLWGDFTTGSKDVDITTPKLTNYNRVLTGAKLTLNIPYLSYLPDIDLFGAMSNQQFGRDEIKGAGVSGPYYTSKYPMVNGTERIIIETRDRVFTTKILNTKTMNRLSDYNVDYGNGSITFSQPVASFDENLNPNYIVIVYEHYQTSISSNIFGARFKEKLPFGISIGGSYIRENFTDQPYQLYGFNVADKLWDKVDLIGEYANSFSENKYGSSYRAALSTKPFDNLTLNGEYQIVDANFSNKAGGSLTPGTERYSLKTDYKPFQQTNLTLEFNRDNNFITNQLVQALRTGVTQDIFSHNISLNFEGRNFTDPKNKNKTLTSGLIGFGYKTPTFYNISLNLNRDQNVLGEIDPSKPTVTTLGVDYTLFDSIKLFAKQNFFEREKLTMATVIGVDSGFKRDSNFLNAVNVGAKYQVDGAIEGRAAQSSIGLNNRINVLPDLLLGISYERVMSEKTADKDKAFNLDDDHNAWSFSVEFTPNEAGFRGSAKYDFRDGIKSTNLLALNLAGALGDDFGIFGRFTTSNSSDAERRNSTEGLVGIAYRPLSSDFFNALLKYQIKNRTEGTLQISNITNHIFSLEGFFQPLYALEVYTKLALKNSWDKTFNFQPIASNISLGLARVTYKFNYNFDLVGEYRNLTQFETMTSFNDFTTEIGYFPIKDLRIAAGYNFFGYNDKDLAASNYTSQGPYIGLSLKVGNLGNLWGQNGAITKKDLIEQADKGK